ncbi:MAG: hypothetical protein OEZ01_10960 [Candidatus Heimdallarchaeota archaeon]|nr:hypothetical protein [Candidatus Heimdallarchaeota archaeon]MDH5646521.1 hypothetical protein [Candidatus Heimdallarchaeota archaeon]
MHTTLIEITPTCVYVNNEIEKKEVSAVLGEYKYEFIGEVENKEAYIGTDAMKLRGVLNISYPFYDDYKSDKILLFLKCLITELSISNGTVTFVQDLLTKVQLEEVHILLSEIFPNISFTQISAHQKHKQTLRVDNLLIIDFHKFQIDISGIWGEKIIEKKTSNVNQKNMSEIIKLGVINNNIIKHGCLGDGIRIFWYHYLDILIEYGRVLSQKEKAKARLLENYDFDVVRYSLSKFYNDEFSDDNAILSLEDAIIERNNTEKYLECLYVYGERYLVGEAYFNPNIIGIEEKGLHHLLEDIVLRYQLQEENVCIILRGEYLKGLSQRLAEELKGLKLNNITVLEFNNLFLNNLI